MTTEQLTVTDAHAIERRENNSVEHAAHAHGSAPHWLPHWMQERWTILLVIVAATAFLAGWVGSTFLGLPEGWAIAFYIIAYLAAGYDIATHAVPGLLKGEFDTDVLMLAAALGAALLGAWAEGAFLLLLFAIGHAGEHYAMDRARNAISALSEYIPDHAQVRRDGVIVELAVDAVQVGDIVLVRAGDRIAVDGEVTAGSSEVNQAPITGESVPVAKTLGDAVFAGTINGESALEVRATTLAQDNTLSRVLQMVAEAQEQQSPTQQTTQRFMKWFVPAVLLFVLAMIVAPPLLGWLSWSDAFYKALLLLVAASPCALAIGTPAAVLAAIAQGARNGVLIKGGAHLENLGGVDAIAFDKTGTLTEGRFAVAALQAEPAVSEETLLATAASVEQQSSHPLARAIVAEAKVRGVAIVPADEVENRAGRGITATVGGERVLVGSARLFAEEGIALPSSVQAALETFVAQGATTMVVWRAGRMLGVIALADQPRTGIAATLDALRALGVQKLVMLTGDGPAQAQRIAQAAGVGEVKAALLPAEKVQAIAALRASGHGVAMVGDGVNDAPALAAATVGIAMGGAGSAVALESADVALMADDLGRLPFAIGLSRASRAIIWQNLAIAMGVILLLILASVVGVVQLSGAVILHEGSTIVVVLNALRLLRYQ